MAQRGGSHGYCLKWKYHPNNLLHMFNQLLLNESFTDVLVACEGKAIKCHKMVLSACSKYFEQVFCEYPQQNSTLVILKDMKFADVQAIIEFMYQGEINVAHDQLASLLKAAESLQVKGLADITGANSGSNHGGASLTGGSKEDGTDYGDRDTGGEDSTPGSPPSGCLEGNSDGGSLQEQPSKKKRGRPPMGLETSMSDGMSMTVSGGNPMIDTSQGFDDFPGNLLESHFALPRIRKSNKRKPTGMPAEMEQDDDMEDDGMDLGTGEDDEVTEEDLQNIVKMTDYIEKGGSRPQFWEEPTTKKIMNAIRSKKMEMKAAAEILGVSYSTLYSRYRELHGYLKMPHTQDTNFNYYQVLNLLRAGQISLTDAAKRLNIHEKTLGAYLSTTITPKKPRISITPSTSALTADAQSFAM
ncbi:Protein bric-a-brac 1, partial [Orchesella cincta]